MDSEPSDMGMEEGGEAMPKEGMDEQPAQNTVMLSADHFPPGTVPKSGDKLTFNVTGEPDKEGNVMGYFSPTDGKEEGGNWEKGFRESMSPTAMQGEAA